MSWKRIALYAWELLLGAWVTLGLLWFWGLVSGPLTDRVFWTGFWLGVVYGWWMATGDLRDALALRWRRRRQRLRGY